jgi:cytochrome c553
MDLRFRGTFLLPAALPAVLLFATIRPLPAGDLPAWAYGTKVSDASAAAARTLPKHERPPANEPKHLPGSKYTFTRAQANNFFGPGDWFPDDHPKMPEIVAHGRKPDIWACSLCHYPNGKGRPENAGVSGLPVSYFIHQMRDFRDGSRKSADPQKKNTKLMAQYAKAMTDEEIKQAAEYFGAMKWTPWIKVVETDKVPKNHLSVGMFLPIEGAGKEPLGDRIIEMPVNPEATEQLRDSHSGFIAYVPVGSVAKGRELATGGAGKTVRCAVCHGADLRGMGPVPGIAGRSPSYLMRQMYDMQQGSRNGEWTQLMKPVVASLSNDDMLEIVAYVSSLEP